MFKLVARTKAHRLMFRTWGEAHHLWDVVLAATPGRVALVLMPDHLHLVHPRDVRCELAAALAGYTRSRNQQHGRTGPLFDTLPEAEALADAAKVRRQIRYIHLNPCRGKLVRDPLSWPFSTHRDACGLALPPVVRVVRDIARFHHYVSADPDVSVDGTELPPLTPRAANPLAVLQAVSAVTRTNMRRLVRRGAARSLYLRAAVELCPDATYRTIGQLVHVEKLAVLRAARPLDGAVSAVSRALDDPRFQALHDRPQAWPIRRYRDG